MKYNSVPLKDYTSTWSFMSSWFCCFRSALLLSWVLGTWGGVSGLTLFRYTHIIIFPFTGLAPHNISGALAHTSLTDLHGPHSTEMFSGGGSRIVSVHMRRNWIKVGMSQHARKSKLLPVGLIKRKAAVSKMAWEQLGAHTYTLITLAHESWERLPAYAERRRCSCG